MSPIPLPRLLFYICLSAEAFPGVEMAMLKPPKRQPNPYRRANILVLCNTQPSFKTSVLQAVMESSK